MLIEILYASLPFLLIFLICYIKDNVAIDYELDFVMNISLSLVLLKAKLFCILGSIQSILMLA